MQTRRSRPPAAKRRASASTSKGSAQRQRTVGRQRQPAPAPRRRPSLRGRREQKPTGLAGLVHKVTPGRRRSSKGKGRLSSMVGGALSGTGSGKGGKAGRKKAPLVGLAAVGSVGAAAVFKKRRDSGRASGDVVTTSAHDTTPVDEVRKAGSPTVVDGDAAAKDASTGPAPTV